LPLPISSAEAKPQRQSSKAEALDIDAPAIGNGKLALSLDADEPLAGESFVDLGLPIPDTYGTDILRAMIQDPFRVFIYWEVRRDHLDSLTRYFSPEDIKTFKTVLKLRDTLGGQESYFDVDRRGRYWMMVLPGHEYQFEIGVQSPLHGYISLLASNRVQTPRGTISPITAQSEEYRLQPTEFVEVMEKSGFGAEQSLDITVAAMPGTNLRENILSETLNRLSERTREAIMYAVSGGHLTAEMIAELPETIRDLVLSLYRESGSELASAGLMHYMPELLRETIESEEEWISDPVHPMRVVPRFFIGASENAPQEDRDLQFPKKRHTGSDAIYRKPEISFGSTLRQLLLQLG
jgi:hypothetical protein